MTAPQYQALNKSTDLVDKPEDIFGLSPHFPCFKANIHHCLIFRRNLKALKINETFQHTCQVFENKDSFVTDL
jgi:hypothetical protein